MTALAPDLKITLVQSLDEALDLRAWLSDRRDFLAVDVETEGVNLGRDKIRLFQIGDTRRGFALAWEDWRGLVKDVLPQYRGKIAAHNLTFDLATMKRDGVHLQERLSHCTMIMAHLVNSGTRIGLKPTAARIVGPQALMGQGELEEAFQKYGWNWATVPLTYPAYWHYGVLDTCLTSAIAEHLYPLVQADYAEIYEIEMASIFVLCDARLRGMRVDLDYVQETRASMLAEMAELDERTFSKIGLAPSSDKKVREYIESVAQQGPLGSWWPFRTEKGEVSVDDDALRFFESDFPDLIPDLRRWRRCNFLVGHYFDNILHNHVDSIVRPNIRQVLRTGRMSITDPPLQTLPRGTDVRDAFIAREKHKIVQADFQQMELRGLAYYSQCRPMIEAFQRGEDMHSWVGAYVYHDGNQDRLTKLQRQVSKNVNFAKGYGAGDTKIAATAGVDVETIKEFQSKYDALFPEIKQFMQTLIGQMHQRHKADKQMWVKTVLGRRLVVDDEKPYVGVNYLNQGGMTGDILKLKIVELDAAGVGNYILLPVHDELLFDVPDEDIDDVLETVNRVMPERQLLGDCHLTIDTDVVERWGDHFRNPADRIKV